jgi:hypothetical protein
MGPNVKYKQVLSFCMALVLGGTGTLLAQKGPRIVAEATIIYSIKNLDSSVSKQIRENLDKSTKTVFVKGLQCRSDVASPSFSQTTLFNYEDSVITILRTIGANKFLTQLKHSQWRKMNDKFVQAKFVPSTTDSLVILGYACARGTLQLSNGTQCQVWYTKDFVTSATDNEYQFKLVPGFVLQYAMQDEVSGGYLQYTVSQMNTLPVPGFMFDVPTKGYRILQ